MIGDPLQFRISQVKNLSDVPSNRFAFAVGVGGQNHFVGLLGQSAQLGDHRFFARTDFVMRDEATRNINRVLVGLGQVADVTDARAHRVLAAKILANRLGFGRRLHD